MPLGFSIVLRITLNPSLWTGPDYILDLVSQSPPCLLCFNHNGLVSLQTSQVHLQLMTPAVALPLLECFPFCCFLGSFSHLLHAVPEYLLYPI